MAVSSSSVKPRATKKAKSTSAKVVEEMADEAVDHEEGLEIVPAGEVVERREEEVDVEASQEEEEEEIEEKENEEKEEGEKEGEEEEEEGPPAEGTFIFSTLVRHNLRRTVRLATSPPMVEGARYELPEGSEVQTEVREAAEGSENAYVSGLNLREGDNMFSSTSAAVEFAEKGLTPADRERLAGFSGIELGSLTISTACQMLMLAFEESKRRQSFEIQLQAEAKTRERLHYTVNRQLKRLHESEVQCLSVKRDLASQKSLTRQLEDQLISDQQKHNLEVTQLRAKVAHLEAENSALRAKIDDKQEYPPEPQDEEDEEEESEEE